MAAVVFHYCSTCEKNTPHVTVGVKREAEDGPFQGQVTQPSKCAECGTYLKVAGGEDGETFQENYDSQKEELC